MYQQLVQESILQTKDICVCFTIATSFSIEQSHRTWEARDVYVMVHAENVQWNPSIVDTLGT